MRKLKLVGSTAMLLALISGSVIKTKPAKADNVSVYGPESGAMTANGESFRWWSDFTAAHPWLPFGSILRVCRESGDPCTVVRVNDRSPWATWDVSWIAGEALGLTNGVGRCQCPVEVLYVPEAA